MNLRLPIATLALALLAGSAFAQTPAATPEPAKPAAAAAAKATPVAAAAAKATPVAHRHRHRTARHALKCKAPQVAVKGKCEAPKAAS